MSTVATVMLVDMVGEAGDLELAVLAGGAVLGVLLGGRLVSNKHRVSIWLHPSRGPPSDRSGAFCSSHNLCEGYGSK